MMFRVIDEKKADLSINRKCALFGVSTSGYYAWKHRRPSKRQLDDMVFLAHIRSQFTTSHETYGSPRMHIELQEDGLAIGRHRVDCVVPANQAVEHERHVAQALKNNKVVNSLYFDFTSQDAVAAI